MVAAKEEAQPAISTSITGKFRNPSASFLSTSPFRKKIEQDRVVNRTAQEISKRANLLNWAQRIGLPPPLQQDWTLFWDEPVRTINYDLPELEMEVQEPTSAKTKHQSVGPVSRFSTSTSDPGPRSPIDDEGPMMRFWKPNRTTGTVISDIGSLEI